MLLTQYDAYALGRLLRAIGAADKVTFSRDGGDTILDGELRHIVLSEDCYAFLPHDRDVREGFVRITLRSGLDIALAVPEILSLMSEGLFTFAKTRH